MSPLPSGEQLRQRKAVEHAELERQRARQAAERRGLEECCARYWELLGDFVGRAAELGVEPRRHEPTTHGRSRIAWVEGFLLRSGSIVTAPPLQYCVRERRLVSGHRVYVRPVEELSLFVLSVDAGLATGLSEPKTASGGEWPPFRRWDRAANILLALEAELEATLLELMDAIVVDDGSENGQAGA
jgi:hypothetical protein